MRTLISAKTIPLTAIATLALALAGCATTAQKSDDAAPATSTSASKTSGKAARQEPAPSTSGDRKVKGRGDWEGYINGSPWKGAKFSRLEIGMSYSQVLNLIGPPSDQYSHPTGKAWIPFYYGSGRYEHKLLYRGNGRLVFAGDAGFSGNAHLIGIEYNRSETGYQ